MIKKIMIMRPCILHEKKTRPKASKSSSRSVLKRQRVQRREGETGGQERQVGQGRQGSGVNKQEGLGRQMKT